MKSVIVPAYNEELRIEACLAWCLNLFDEIVVVCDGTDLTEDYVKFHRVLDDRVVLVQSEFRLGKGGALLRGFEASHGSIVFLVDADFPVPSRYVCLFEEYLRYADVVIGSRYLPESQIVSDVPLNRRIMSRAYRLFVSVLFHKGIHDFQCGFKAFRRSVLESVKHDMVLSGFAFDLELVLRAKNMGFRVEEVPVMWSYREGSKVNLKTGWNMLREVAKLRVNIK